ncbi:uncharacterized protein LOC106702815 isoform X2 [Latimeria chalumnae]|nr:PREDICTED: uncharacterized protein LOC106702815 isoform X2 [Latimeria chalumnae]|eukprot:XP_014341656.1 PREDICTED: uncharacterized protein LOC106702815 isoform X2 [Latimeria chalumnae]
MVLSALLMMLLLPIVQALTAPMNCTERQYIDPTARGNMTKLYGNWNTLAIATNSERKKNYFYKLDNAQISIHLLEKENKSSLTAMIRRDGMCIKRQWVFTASNSTNEVAFEDFPNTNVQVFITPTGKHFIIQETTEKGSINLDTMYLFGKNSSLASLPLQYFQHHVECLGTTNHTVFLLPQEEGSCTNISFSLL